MSGQRRLLVGGSRDGDYMLIERNVDRIELPVRGQGGVPGFCDNAAIKTQTYIRRRLMLGARDQEEGVKLVLEVFMRPDLPHDDMSMLRAVLRPNTISEIVSKR